MSPPGGALRTPARPGGFIAPDALIRDMHRLMAHHGIVIGPRKVHRLVRDFVTLATKMTFRGDVGVLFGAYLEHRLDITHARRLEMADDPEWSRVIRYMDNTGEWAVENVMTGSTLGHHGEIRAARP